MQTENRVVDDHGQRKIGKNFDYLVPNVVVSVLFLDFIVEAVSPREGRGFVVASEEDEGGGAEALEDEEVADGFGGLVASVDVVSEEDVVALGRDYLRR